MIRKLNTVKLDHNFEVETWRFFNRGLIEGGGRMVRAYQIRPVNHLLTEIAMFSANSGLSLDRMGEAFGHVEKYGPHISHGQKRVDYPSILWSKRTESFALTHPAHFSYCLHCKRASSGRFQRARIRVARKAIS